MASTAWTVTRAELVEQLAKTRAERDIAVARVHTLEAAQKERRLAGLAREARYRENRQARLTAEAIQELAKAQRIAETIPPDPNAKQHRTDLIAALKEKP
jgi:hypothetical protein